MIKDNVLGIYLGMRKILCAILVLNFCVMNILPVFSAGEADVVFHREKNKEVIEQSSKLHLAFANEFNVNESEQGDEVLFYLAEALRDNGVIVLPYGTKFVGRIIDKTDSKFGFRKAKANIAINRLVLPSGESYEIFSIPEQGTLTSPVSLNILKGVGTAAIATTVGVFGAAVIAIECLSVGGLIFAPYTGAAIGVAVAASSKGLNYKVNAGTPITIVLQRPLEINIRAISEQR